MAGLQIIGSSPAVVAGNRPVPSFDGLRLAPSQIRMFSAAGGCRVRSEPSGFRGLVVKAATVVAPKKNCSRRPGWPFQNGFWKDISHSVLVQENLVMKEHVCFFLSQPRRSKLAKEPHF